MCLKKYEGMTKREKNIDQDSLKKFLISIYFSKYSWMNLDDVKLSLNYYDNMFRHIKILPKRFVRKYTLLLRDTSQNIVLKSKIPHKEKEAVKYFINIINK